MIDDLATPAGAGRTITRRPGWSRGATGRSGNGGLDRLKAGDHLHVVLAREQLLDLIDACPHDLVDLPIGTEVPRALSHLPVANELGATLAVHIARRRQLEARDAVQTGFLRTSRSAHASGVSPGRGLPLGSDQSFWRGRWMTRISTRHFRVVRHITPPAASTTNDHVRHRDRLAKRTPGELGSTFEATLGESRSPAAGREQLIAATTQRWRRAPRRSLSSRTPRTAPRRPPGP